jgi:LuxR family maltose regulon positive regulatory protein
MICWILVDMVLDKLYTLPGKTMMVLDDYHLIKDEIVQNSLIHFTKYLPSHFKMMILSRTAPRLNVLREWAGGS